MSLSFLFAHLASVLGLVLVLAVIASMLRQRREPTSTTAWLLAIVLAPWIGVPAYLIFGNRKLLAARDLKTPLKLRQADVALAPPAASADRLIQSYGLPAAVPGNRLTLCVDGVDIYRRTLDVIASAERRVHLATFILHPDPVGTAIVAALARRAADGLEVRLLLDGVGSFTTRASVLAPLVEAGGKLGWFLPITPRRLLLWNLRNHRKATIADDGRVIAGGANIAGDYMGPAPDPRRWRDLSFLLEGPAVLEYADMFRADWAFATGEVLQPAATDMPAPPGDTVAQVLPSGPDVPGDPYYSVLLAAAFSAKRRLWLVTPYFLPPAGLAEALGIAAHRGVDVQILVPDPSNHRMADWARAPILRDLQQQGCRIIRCVDGMVHAKIVVIDDEAAMVGSPNIDPRSFFLNFEAVCVFYGPRPVQQVTDWIDRLRRGTVEGVPPVGRWRDTAEGLARMLDPLL
jgi:cardiolipin synthase A/B